ncbi:MAG: alpha/beta hydrolase [Pseudomonadota bacterium]
MMCRMVVLFRFFVAVFALTLGSAATATTFEERVLKFESRGVLLEGTLVLPTSIEPTAAVVFVHGSGRQPRSLPLARAFAQAGIAAFVYDKRGVGESAGRFEGDQPVSESNLDLLAADARAALQVLVDAPSLNDIPRGFTGLSQAGWIVPLAAKDSKADFLLLWSGPVCKISEEDIFSKYTRNSDAARIPSYDEALAAQTSAYVWPTFLGRDTDSAADLATLGIPGLWIFGENDGSVPVDLSIRKLRKLQDDGHNYQYVLFSGIGHNNVGATFDTAVAWIRSIATEE